MGVELDQDYNGNQISPNLACTQLERLLTLAVLRLSEQFYRKIYLEHFSQNNDFFLPAMTFSPSNEVGTLGHPHETPPCLDIIQTLAIIFLMAPLKHILNSAVNDQNLVFNIYSNPLEV